MLSLKQLQTTEWRRCTLYFAQVKTNYNFFHQQTLLVPCFHLFLLMLQTVQSLSTPEKRNEGIEHSSPQLPHRSPQYSRWRLNTGEFTTGLFSVGSGNTPSLKLYFTNTLSYAKLKKHYASDLTGGANIALGTSPRLSLRAFDSPSRRFPTKYTFVRVRFWTRF